MVTRAWWSRAPAPGNLGDVLAPIVLEGLGVPVRWTNEREAELFSIGSVVSKVRAGQKVWGSGVMWHADRPDPGAEYLAVRGPVTRECVLANGGECPEIYGDPALTLPLFYDEPVEKKYAFGVVPHYVDLEAARFAGFENVISPLTADPLAVVDRIRECRMIASSSLHGIIVAHAYGIPAGWLRLSDGLDGDDSKFRDYAEAVGTRLLPSTSLATFVPTTINFNVSPLVEALEAVRG